MPSHHVTASALILLAVLQCNWRYCASEHMRPCAACVPGVVSEAPFELRRRETVGAPTRHAEACTFLVRRSLVSREYVARDPERSQESKASKRAIALIEQAGGTVTFEKENDANGPCEVVLDGAGCDDRCIPALSGVPHVKCLIIHETKITSDGLARLDNKAIENVERLVVNRIRVPDAVVRRISKLKRLHKLVLQSVDLRDEQLGWLANLGSLELLGLTDNPITDDGVSHLGKMDRLALLDLSGTKISDRSLVHVSRSMPVLQVLEAARTAVTDEGVGVLVSLPRITELNLTCTKISDNCSQSLLRIKYLDTIVVADNDITDRWLSAVSGAKRNS